MARGTRIALGLLAVSAALQISWRLRSSSPQDLRFEDVQVGDTLANLVLHPLPYGAASTWPRAPRTQRLHELFATSCGLAFFYLSTCPACRIHAPRWSGVNSVRGARSVLPLVWIALATDTAASTFLEDYGLRGHAYVSSSIQEWAAIGVSRTPTLYLIRGGVLQAEVPPTPDSVLAHAPPSCTS
jgi:hypothetical protein